MQDTCELTTCLVATCIIDGWCSVESYLLSKGWWKTDHKVMYTLKWTENRHDIDFQSFREGEQLANHFPNVRMLTTKIGLLETLSTYYKAQRLGLA